MKASIFACCALCLFALALPATGLSEGRFDRYDLTVPGKVTEVINEDIDGDGLLDVIAINLDQKGDHQKRYLDIFIQDKDHGFDDSKRIQWEMSPEVAAIDVGDVAPDKGRELVFITENGIYYSTVKDGKVSALHELLKAQSVVAIASKRIAPYYNFVWDYTGDGKDDILVCGFYEAVFAKQGDDYTFTTQIINLRPDIDVIAFDLSALMISPEHPVFRVSYQVPQVYSNDYDGDGLPDLIAVFREELKFYKQGPDGFSKEPTRDYTVKLLEEENPQMRGPPPQFDFEDIDKDGKVDIVAHHTTGRIGAMKSRSVLFWGNSDNIAKGKPDIEFKTQYTVMAKIIIWDVNGDGLYDLIMPTYNISAWNLGKILFTGDITVEWVYFIQNPDHTFNNTPDRTISTDMKVNLTKFRLESGIPNIVADFNGDGFPDQAMGESENVLVITLRDNNGQPLPVVEKVQVPVAMFFRAVDLNNDGLSDILMYYIQNEEHEHDVKILMNKGNWDVAQPQ